MLGTAGTRAILGVGPKVGVQKIGAWELLLLVGALKRAFTSLLLLELISGRF